MNVQGISVRKSRRESLFLVIAFLSALLSITVISAAPLYFDSIKRLGLQRTLERFEPSQMGSWLHVEGMTFNPASVKSTVETAESAGEHFGDTVRDRGTFIRSGGLTLNRINDRYAPPGSVLVYQSVRGIEPAVSIVDGAFPSDSPAAPLEIAVLDTVAEEYGVNVGDSLLLSVPPTTIVHTAPKVSGIFRIDDPNHESWLGLSSTLVDPEQGPTGGRPAIIALTSNSMIDRVANRGIADVGQLWTMFYTDVDELKRVGAGAYLESIESFRTESAKTFPNSTSFSALESALVTLQKQLTFTNTTAIISGALFAAFAIFVLALNAGIIARRWLAEEIILKTRGADRRQLLRAASFYVGVLFLIPAVLGPLLASAIVPMLGLIGSFQDLTGGKMFPFRILGEQFVWSGAVAILLLALFAAPVIHSRPGPIVHYFNRLRDTQSPWFWRANLDIGIVIAASAVIFELNGRGSLFVQRSEGASNLSVLATSLPIMAAVAASLVALRFFNLIGIVFERLARINFNSMIVLALKVFSRSTMRHAVLMMLAAGTMVVVINASGLSGTLGKNTRDRINFATAADMRISGIDSFKTSNNHAVLKIAELDWVADTTWAARTEAATGIAESSSNFTMLSVRPNEYRQISSFRPDFADLPLHQLMDNITHYSPTGSLPLPDNISFIQATVKLERAGKGRIDIWSRLRDSEGTTHTIRLSSEDETQTEENWLTVRGEVREDLSRPLELLAIQVYEPPTAPVGSTATLTIDSLHAIEQDGALRLVSDFADDSVWHPFAASISDNVDLSVTEEGGADSVDDRSLAIDMGRGTDDGVRGVYYSENKPIVIPLLVNQALMDASGLSVGDTFAGQSYGRFVPFEIRGTFDLFPTMTDEDQPFAVANIDALLSYLAPVSEPFLANSAELFVKVRNTVDHEERIAAIKDIEPSLRVSDREALQAQSSSRLGDAAGWRVVGTIISVSAIAVTVITALAIAIHNQDQTSLDAALIESLGGSRAGLTLEASIQIFLSIGIGSALGWFGGIVGVRFVADRMTRTSTGEVALPPMLLQIDWLPVAAAVLLLLLALLVPVVRSRIKPKDTVAMRIRSSSEA